MYRVRIPDFREAAYSFTQLTGVSARPSPTLEEGWEGAERPATLLIIRFPMGHRKLLVPC